MLDDRLSALTRKLDPRRGSGGNLVLLRPHDGRPYECLTLDPHDEVFIGREPAQTPGVIDVLVDLPVDQGVSRRHALLAFQDGRAHVMDLGSTNGTWLNGLRLPAQEPVPLTSGDLIQAGRRTFLWFEGWHPVLRAAEARDWLARREFESCCLRALAQAQDEAQPLALMVVREHPDVPHTAESVDAPAWRFLLSLDDALGWLSAREWGVLLWGVDLGEACLVAELVRQIVPVAPRADGRRHKLPVEVGLAPVSVTQGLRLGRSKNAVGEPLSVERASVELLIERARADCRESADDEDRQAAHDAAETAV